MGIPVNHPAVLQAYEKGLMPQLAALRVTGPTAFLLPTLPFPPTVNRYWRRVGNKTLLSANAREYRRRVVAVLDGHKHGLLVGAVELTITFCPPDRRKRDLDNLPKGLLDALKYAGIYEDDSQVWRIDMRFGGVVKGGSAVVTVRQTEGAR